MHGLNLCSTSVLDRLDPLLEPNVQLVLNERGLVNGELQIVKPHPDFQIFMSMNPPFQHPLLEQG